MGGFLPRPPPRTPPRKSWASLRTMDLEHESLEAALAASTSRRMHAHEHAHMQGARRQGAPLRTVRAHSAHGAMSAAAAKCRCLASACSACSAPCTRALSVFVSPQC